MGIGAMSKQMNADYMQESEYMNAWKTAQENVMNECRKHAMSEMTKLFEQIASKQINSFQSQHLDFMNMLNQNNQDLSEDHMNPLNEILNEYKTSNNKINEEINCKSKHSFDAIQENVENVSSESVNNWSKKMDTAMNDLSESIQASHKNTKDLITNKIKKNMNEFNQKSNQCHDELIEFNKKQSENICDISKSLQTHNQRMSEYNESNLPYFDQLSLNLNEIKRESEIHQVSKYKKSGETPLKKNVIYPLKFVQTESFESLISQFNEDANDENKNTLNQSIGSSYISSLKSTRSSSPFFIKEEIEINFCEKELGFRMYAGENDTNCFIRHCHSDVRVSDDAQIIAIDGIDVVDKSVGYIRTLLATEQRPISIKFKNNLDDNKENPVINNLDNSTLSTSSVLSDSYCNITTKKRKKRDIVKPKVKKLNYATPNAKRHKRNVQNLSPINNDKMDVDVE